MGDKKIKVTMTKKQACLIELALETLSRMSMGQLREIIRGIEGTRNEMFTDYGKRNLAFQIIDEKLKKLLFPELEKNASYGVGSKIIGDAQIMYEMVKCLQNFRSKDMSGEEAGVLKHEPLHYSEEPLIEVEE